MHFLVFIPDCNPQELEQRAKSAGVFDLLGGHDIMPNVTGVDGSVGMMIGWLSPSNPRLDYAPSEQEWIPSILKIGGKVAYWVGFWKKELPKEGELRRHYTQAGPLTPFGESRWKLPTPDTVDARAVYADDGSMRWETVRQFSWMCDEAKAIHDEYLESFGVRQLVFNVDPVVQVSWLLKLLRVNYRLTPEVAVRLDMWIGRDHIMDTFLSTLGLHRKSSNV